MCQSLSGFFFFLPFFVSVTVSPFLHIPLILSVQYRWEVYNRVAICFAKKVEETVIFTFKRGYMPVGQLPPLWMKNGIVVLHADTYSILF